GGLARSVKLGAARLCIDFEPKYVPAVGIDLAMAPLKGVRPRDVHRIAIARRAFGIEFLVVGKQDNPVSLRDEMIAVDSDVSCLAPFIERGDAEPRRREGHRPAKALNRSRLLPALLPNWKPDPALHGGPSGATFGGSRSARAPITAQKIAHVSISSAVLLRCMFRPSVTETPPATSA